MCDLFGGPSYGERAALDSTTQYANAMMANYNQQYQQQQGALTNMQAQIARLQSGQTGPGFSGDENAARISYIKNLYAAQARNEAQAARSRGAGSQVSPSGGMTRQSGINQQIDAEATSRAQAGEANDLIKEQAENFAQGRTNTERAISGWDALAGRYNPQSYAGMAESGYNTEFSESQQIQKEKQQRAANIFGAATKLASGIATFGIGGIGALGAGESFGEGVGDFLKGGLNETFGTNFGVGGGGGGAYPGQEGATGA